jgi:hypothetical protein
LGDVAPIDCAMAAASGHAEVTVTWVAVYSSKRVTVECVAKVHLEEDVLPLADARPLDQGKVLVVVPGTSPPGNSSWDVAENKSSAGGKGSGAWVFKRGTVHWAWAARSIRSKDSICRGATAIPGGAERRRPPCRMRPEHRLSGNQAITVIPRAIGVGSGVLIDNRRRSRWTPLICQPPSTLLPTPWFKYFLPGPAGNS